MRHMILAVGLWFAGQLFAVAQTSYTYTTDLRNVEDGKVKVTLVPPAVTQKTVVFQMPSIVPGTYAKKDYGRFITEFKAIGRNGRALPTKRKSDNVFEIKRANQLARIEYNVRGSWSDTDYKNWVFQPSGTNIEKDKNFLINHHGFYGYLEGYKNLPFEMRYTKPANLYGATALPAKSRSASEDVFTAPSYTFLVDNPLMYAPADTTSFMVYNMRVLVASYSPNKVISAKQLSGYLQPISQALGSFFGTLPVDHYTFLFYFAPEDTEIPEAEGLSGYGALEHSYSSTYYLPETDYEPGVKQMVQDVAAHEFLHILTPLNIHSTQIEDFNFVQPVMSQHLWMYEGITEYFAHLIQVRGGIISEDDFVKEIRNKILSAAQYKNHSFTDMSKKVVDADMQEIYPNVYQKGALMGLALDLQLIELSDGKYGLRELMMDLAKKYGPNKPFNDETFIDEVIGMTYPQLRPFFDQYIIGDKTIDYAQYFPIVGWEYKEKESQTAYSFGDFGITYDPVRNGIAITTAPENNTLGLQEDDILRSINGKVLNMNNPLEMQDVLVNEFFDRKNEQTIAITVERNGQEVTLSGKPRAIERNAKSIIRSVENPTAKQLIYRQFLLTGKPSDKL